MLRFVLLASIVATALASGGYGGYRRTYGSNYGGSKLANFGSGLSGTSMSMSSMGSMGAMNSMGAMDSADSMSSMSSMGYSGGIIPAAVQSRRSIAFMDVPSTYEAAAPLTIDIAPNSQPINFLMRSRSSPLDIQTTHEAQPGSYQETSSVDAPHVRVHTVQRPVIQKVNEIISPYRKVQQEVLPVREEVSTLISRGQNTAYAPAGGLSSSTLITSGISSGMASSGMASMSSMSSGSGLGLSKGYAASYAAPAAY